VARFSTYAEVATPDHPMTRAREERGLEPPQGHLLADVLTGTDGRYEVLLDLPQRARDHIARAAEVTADAELAALARLEEVPISLEHLREHDPATTRIYYGTQLEREESDDNWWDPAPG
jgi:hypothetical protein